MKPRPMEDEKQREGQFLDDWRMAQHEENLVA